MAVLESILEILSKTASLIESDASGHARWLDMTRIQREREGLLAKQLQGYLVSQINRLNARLNDSNWKDAESLLSWDTEAQTLKALLRSDYMDAFAYGYSFAQEEVNDIRVGKRESVACIHRACRSLSEADPAGYLALQGAIEAVEEALDELTAQISETTKDQIKKALRQTIADGGSVAQLKDEIVKAFETAGMEIAEYRAIMIARTELIRALNAGARKAYEDSGFLKDVNAAFDITVRDSEGKEVKSYRVMYPPAHPQCRCTTALDPDKGVIIWYTSLDERVCDICAPLDGVAAN